jgi:hypothetical protein
MSQIFNADLIDFDDTPSSASVEEFPSAIRLLAERHRPSRMPFFRNLAALDPAAAGDPSLLGQIYLVYQAAMLPVRRFITCRISIVPPCASASCRSLSTMMGCPAATRIIIN